MLTMLHFLYSKPSNSSKRYCASILVTLKARIETFELQYAAETSGTAGEAPIVRGRFASWHGRHHDDLEKASARRLGKSTAAASAACRSLLCVHPGDINASFLLIPSLNVSSFRTSLTIVTGHKRLHLFLGMAYRLTLAWCTSKGGGCRTFCALHRLGTTLPT